MQVEKFDPIKELESLGKLSPIPDGPADKEKPKFKVHYEVYNVNITSEKQVLCGVKERIVNDALYFTEETTFDKSGNWLVALCWYEEV